MEKNQSIPVRRDEFIRRIIDAMHHIHDLSPFVPSFLRSVIH
jgi:hypothetical protein